MNEVDVMGAIFEEMEDFSQDNQISVAWPNVDFDRSQASEFLDVDLMFSERFRFGLAPLTRETVILHVNIFGNSGVGVVKAHTLASKVIAHFPPDTSLCAGDGMIKVEKFGHVHPYINDDHGWFFVPTSIKFRLFRGI